MNKPAFDDLDPGDFLKNFFYIARMVIVDPNLLAIIVTGAVYMSVVNILGIHGLF